MNIKHTAETDDVTVRGLARFLSSIPAEGEAADVVPILGTTGHQRDPVTVLRGLRVTWETEAR